jgi:predicted MFS family arabinose efflux permease
VLRGALMLSVAAGVLLHHAGILVVYLAAIGLGLVNVVATPAATTALVEIADGDTLAHANSRLEVSQTACENVGGPALGGVVYALGRAVPFLGNAVSFFASALLLRGLPRTGPERAVARPSWRSEVAEGMRWLVRNELCRTLAGVISLLAVAQSMAFGVLVVLARQSFGLSDGGFGLLLAFAAIGNVVGGLLAPHVWSLFGSERMLVGGAVLMGLSFVALASARTPMSAAFALLAEGAVVTTTNVVTATMRQRIIPRHMLGRVSNAIRTFIYGAVPLGALVGGLVAHRYGVRTTFAVAGTIDATVAVALIVPLRRLLGSRARQQLGVVA